MTGMLTASLTAAVSSQSKPVRVPSQFIEVSRISPAPRDFGFARPLDGAASGQFAPALHKDLRLAHRVGGFGSRRASMATTTACAPKLRPMASIKFGSAIAAEFTLTLSAPASKTCAASSGGANAAADAEGDKQFTRRPAHCVEQRLTSFVRRGNVEQYDFVRAFAGMTRGLRGGIACIDEIDELHALHNAAVMDIEAGDDAFGHHSLPFPVEKIAENLQPGCAGLFRMKLYAHYVAALDG